MRQVASCLGAFRVSGLVDLVGEDVSGVSQGDREVQPSQQLHQRFAISLFQHSQGVSSLEAVRVVREAAGISERRACGLIGMHRGSWRYRRKERNNAEQTVVIVDPNNPDGGTAFRPAAGKQYFDELGK